MVFVERLRQKFSIRSELGRAALAEFFCTAFLLFTGCSVNAQFVLSQRQSNEWVCVVVGWGIALWLAIQMGFHISGGHVSPAISFFFFNRGQICAVRLAVYAAAQTVGAFVGALMTFIVHYDAINSYDNGTRYVNGPRATAHIFATYPQPHLSTLGAVVDQVMATTVLCLGVAIIIERRNKIPAFLQPMFVGVLMAGLGMMLNLNAGYAVNPARDFAPRLLTFLLGYGWEVFSYRDYEWFWVPILCPMLGAFLGAWSYQIFIGFHLPDDPESISVCKEMLDERNQKRQLKEMEKPLSKTHANETAGAPVCNEQSR